MKAQERSHPCHSRIYFKCNSFLMLVAVMIVAAFFQLWFVFGFCLTVIYRSENNLFFSELHQFSNTILLLPANHTWLVKSQQVEYVRVVEESKTKQTTDTHTPPPAKSPSSGPWQYNLGTGCTVLFHPNGGTSLDKVFLLRSYGLVFLHAVLHAYARCSVFSQGFWCVSWPCQSCE